MFLILFLLQASPLLDLPVKQVVEIIPLTENKILIAHNTEPDVVSIVNTASGEIIQTVIRKGKGPSEAIQIDAMGMDNKTGMVYVCIDYTKIMVLSKDFKLVKERPLQLFGNSISFSNDFIFIGLKSHLTDYKQNVFPACIAIEKKSLSIVDTLFLNTSNFELDKVNQISQIQNIPVYSNVTFLTNSLFVSVNGFPYLFKYETVKKLPFQK